MADSNLLADTVAGAGSGAVSSGLWGAVVGGAAGAANSLLSKPQQGYSLPTDLYNQRLSQIANYSTQLQGATSQYATAIGNMYNTAYNQYLPNAAAAFAGRGLNIDSGAFGAELGRTAASLTSQDLTQVATQNIADINAVNGQYGNAWDDMFGAAAGSSKAGWDKTNSTQAGFGALAGQIGVAGGKALSGYMNKTTNPFNPNSGTYSGSFSPNTGTLPGTGNPFNSLDLNAQN